MQVKEWKEKNKKSFVTKSGLPVTVRRLSPFAVMELGGLPSVENIPEDEQYKMTVAIIKAGLVSPKIGDGENDISIYDLSIEDVNEIQSAILSLSGGGETQGVPLEGTG